MGSLNFGFGLNNYLAKTVTIPLAAAKEREKDGRSHQLFIFTALLTFLMYELLFVLVVKNTDLTNRRLTARTSRMISLSKINDEEDYKFPIRRILDSKDCLLFQRVQANERITS